MAKTAEILEIPATITDRGQTTVPAAIRKMLALGKRDGEDLFHFGFLAVAGHSQFADQEIAGALEHFLFAE